MLVAFCCIVSGCGMFCYGTLWCLFSRMPWWPKMRHSPCALGEWSNASVGPWKSRSVTAWRCAWRCGGFHHRCSLILSLCLYTLFYSFQSLFACMTWHDVTRRSETESETGRLVLTLLYWFTLTKFEALNLHWSNWHKLALKSCAVLVRRVRWRRPHWSMLNESWRNLSRRQKPPSTRWRVAQPIPGHCYACCHCMPLLGCQWPVAIGIAQSSFSVYLRIFITWLTMTQSPEKKLRDTWGLKKWTSNKGKYYNVSMLDVWLHMTWRGFVLLPAIGQRTNSKPIWPHWI
jgi:hypothetical protein